MREPSLTLAQSPSTLSTVTVSPFLTVESAVEDVDAFCRTITDEVAVPVAAYAVSVVQTIVAAATATAAAFFHAPDLFKMFSS